MAQFFEHTHAVVLFLHLLGFSVGVGAAMTGDALLIRALHDPGVGWRTEAIRISSWLIWVALGMVAASGLWLFLPRAGELLGSGRFLTKIVAVLAVAVNGVILQKFLAPRLELLFVSERRTQFESVSRRRFRRLAFASGSVSATSWLVALLLGAMPHWSFSIQAGLLGYLVVIAGAVAFGQWMEGRLARRLRSATRDATQDVASELLEDLNTYDTLISRPRTKR